jgi:hypothetical protein
MILIKFVAGLILLLMTIGEACRAMAKETLRTTLSWAIEQVTRFERPYDHVVAQLGLA